MIARRVLALTAVMQGARSSELSHACADEARRLCHHAVSRSTDETARLMDDCLTSQPVSVRRATRPSETQTRLTIFFIFIFLWKKGLKTSKASKNRARARLFPRGPRLNHDEDSEGSGSRAPREG